MAQDDTSVNNTICATMTWDLDVEVTDGIYKTINPYKWELVCPKYYFSYAGSGSSVTAASVIEAYVSGLRHRPLTDMHDWKLHKRFRAVETMRSSNVTNPNTTSYTSPIIGTGANAASMFYNLRTVNAERSTMEWTNTVYNVIRTSSFIPIPETTAT